MRDYQKSKAYAWEERAILVHDKTLVSHEYATQLLDYVWSEEGLSHPPKLRVFEHKTKSCNANASRLRINMQPEGITASILIHEIAHSMTCALDASIEGNWVIDMHGPDWMGIYIKLAGKYLRLDVDKLLESARKEGLDVNMDATPWVENIRG